MSDRTPVDQLLDVFVFMPIGAVVEARQLLPKLAERGRQELLPQVKLARLAGEMAVRKGRREAIKFVDRWMAARQAAEEREREDAGEPDVERTAVVIDLPLKREDGPGGGVDLAIPSYDSLAASQVVSRLDGLSASELEAVRRYEMTHRGRKTVLGKVAQLQQR
jgi:hypothetical protein